MVRVSDGRAVLLESRELFLAGRRTSCAVDARSCAPCPVCVRSSVLGALTSGSAAPSSGSPGCDAVESSVDAVGIFARQLETNEVRSPVSWRRPASCRCRQTGPARLRPVAAGSDDPTQQLFGHLATVKPGPFLERSRHSREIPRILATAENPRAGPADAGSTCRRADGPSDWPACRRRPIACAEGTRTCVAH